MEQAIRDKKTLEEYEAAQKVKKDKEEEQRKWDEAQKDVLDKAKLAQQEATWNAKFERFILTDDDIESIEKGMTQD